MSQESINTNQNLYADGNNGPVPTTPGGDQAASVNAGNIAPSLDAFDKAPHPVRAPQAQPSIADQTETRSDQSATDTQPDGPVNPLDYAGGRDSVFRKPDPETRPDPDSLDPQKFPDDTSPNN